MNAVEVLRDFVNRYENLPYSARAGGALARLARLVEASKNYRIVRVAGSASMVKIMHDEWIDALAAVLGEEG